MALRVVAAPKALYGGPSGEAPCKIYVVDCAIAQPINCSFSLSGSHGRRHAGNLEQVPQSTETTPSATAGFATVQCGILSTRNRLFMLFATLQSAFATDHSDILSTQGHLSMLCIKGADRHLHNRIQVWRIRAGGCSLQVGPPFLAKAGTHLEGRVDAPCHGQVLVVGPARGVGCPKLLLRSLRLRIIGIAWMCPSAQQGKIIALDGAQVLFDHWDCQDAPKCSRGGLVRLNVLKYLRIVETAWMFLRAACTHAALVCEHSL